MCAADDRGILRQIKNTKTLDIIGGVLWVAADGGQYLRAVDMDVGNQRRVRDPIDDSAAATNFCNMCRPA